MRALGISSAVAAALALAACGYLFVALHDARGDLARQGREGHAVRRLAVSTADAVVLQHRTIGALVAAERSLLGITRALARRGRRYPLASRTLYGATSVP